MGMGRQSPKEGCNELLALIQKIGHLRPNFHQYNQVRCLRHATKPRTANAERKSGRAAGRGMGAIVRLSDRYSICITPLEIILNCIALIPSFDMIFSIIVQIVPFSIVHIQVV